MRTLGLLVALLLVLPGTVRGARIKDLAEIQGVRANALMGYGLVVGLQGTGDSAASLFANRSLAGLLAKLGIVVDPTLLRVKNVSSEPAPIQPLGCEQRTPSLRKRTNPKSKETRDFLRFSLTASPGRVHIFENPAR